jgi:ABC-type multidrug transport system fused ATPase/permease subunit
MLPKPGPVPMRLTFVTTAQMSVDARAALGSPTMQTVHLVGDIALIAVGAALAVAGAVVGYFFVILGLIFLFLSQVAPFQRWLVNRYRRSLLNQPVTVDIDDEALHFATPLATTTIPWSTITQLRATDRSIVFLRDGSPITYLPTAAFPTPADREALIEYARARIRTAFTGFGRE